jgi:flavin reductase (DIM6/NTAB) family NADH-FMN oxidoreductase RutF
VADVRDELLDPGALRRAFGMFATGVTVVTVGGDSPHGMTANSFASVSLDPPLVLVCVGRTAVMHEVLTATGTFAVSVLAWHHEAVARWFADRRRPLGLDQFSAVDWLPGPHTGAPLIAGALAHFECTVMAAYDGGDHTIFLGGLLSAQRCADERALLFVDGAFWPIDSNRMDVTT